MRVVIAHVRDIAVYRIGMCIDRTLSGDNDFRHASLSITASQCTHLPRTGCAPTPWSNAVR